MPGIFLPAVLIAGVLGLFDVRASSGNGVAGDAAASPGAGSSAAAKGVGAPPPWLKEARLFGFDQEAFWSFGEDVDLDGDTAIVGATFALVNGARRGAAYVFVLENGLWVEQAKLVASDGEDDDRFGSSVAVDGDTAVVGAREAVINGEEAQGALYVFTRSGDQWTERAKLWASDGDELDRLGHSLAFGNGTIVSGAVEANFRGAAYVFVGDGANWTEQAKLFDPGGQTSDSFGEDVALDSETALVGALSASIDGDPSRGAAYVYTRSGTTWSLEQKLLASDGGDPDQFGSAVALDRDTALIGARQKILDGDLRRGAAYVFRRNGTTWTEEQRLTASDGQAEGSFGLGAALLGNLALVGAEFTFPGQNERGVVYEFRWHEGTWVEIQKFAAPIGHAVDRFGKAMSLDSTRVLISNEANVFTMPRGGAAWIFRRPILFADGFESGDTGAWTTTIP